MRGRSSDGGARLARPETLERLARDHGGDVDGQARSREVHRFVEPGAEQRETDLVVLTSARRVGDLGDASLVLVSRELAERVPAGRRWVHDHVMWVVAGLVPAAPAPPERSPGAVVEAGAEVAPGVAIGTGAVILEGARLGEGTIVEPGAVVYGGVSLGRRVHVGANAVVGRPGFGWAHGPDGSVRRVPQLGGVVVGDDVEIGPLATVDAGTLGPTRIDDGAKLDAHVHVGHNVHVGAGTFVAAQAGFAGSARIGRGVLIGGQAGVTDHARIGDRAKVSAKAGVIGDIADDLVVAGFPAVSRIRWLRAWARLLGRRDR